MATESDELRVGGRKSRAITGIVALLTVIAAGSAAWWFHRHGAWHPAGAKSPAAQAAVIQDGEMDLEGYQLLVTDDRKLQALPSPTFLVMLRRVAPTRVGTLAALPPADYRFVALRHDDVSDLRSAELLRTAGLEGPVLHAPSEVPWLLEFDLYTSGRKSMAEGDLDGARGQWRALLELPPEQRIWRSTWAAFMLGRSFQKADPREAMRWFRTTRELAAAGFADSLGLALSSIGWEARAELDEGNMNRAIALYLEQFAGGDPSAHPSLHQVIRAVEELPDDGLATLAMDPVARGVITAWAIAGIASSSGDLGTWASAFELRWCDAVALAATQPSPHDDLLAWLAQKADRPELVDRWLATARADSDLVPWITARRAMRTGNVAASVEALRSLVDRSEATTDGEREWSLPGPRLGIWQYGFRWTHRCNRARAELGVLLASEGEFTEALEQFLAAGDWDDAAYVAERVLDIGELRCFVDARPTPRSKWEVINAVNLRDLLARRLAREGQFDPAVSYSRIPQSMARLRDAMRNGFDASLPARDRARALRDAGRITRREGMELLGTELGPDHFLNEGRTQGADIGVARGVRGGSDHQSLVHAAPGEVERTATTGAIPMRRFHYRYSAANLGWMAAQLLPDGDPATAETLCEAGRWVALTDPHVADRFYKALVRRCRNTPLGQEADRRRWFPKSPPAGSEHGRG
jgi:tetratricopeptide (TPR) repeat protein